LEFRHCRRWWWCGQIAPTGRCLGRSGGSGRLGAENAEGLDGPAETAQLETAEGFDGDQGLGVGEGLAIGEYLAGMGLAAQPGGQIGDGADGAVVEAVLEADRADGGEALGDADAEPQGEAAAAPRASPAYRW
jgi:hypothetical protein